MTIYITAPTTTPTPMVTVSITASGNNTAGETYSLLCSVTATSKPTITWSDPTNKTILSDMVTATDNTSTLTFNPLSASDAGTYTCTATLGSDSVSQVVTVQSESTVMTMYAI